MGKPETLPRHKTNKHTRGRLTHKIWMIKCLCENEKCMGKPKMFPSHKENEHLRYECLNAFVKRRGPWESPKHSLNTR